MISIYFCRNILRNKFYVGQTKQPVLRRWKQHQVAARQESYQGFARAIREDGSENFRVGVLAEVPDDVANYMERYYIRAFRANESEFGYNRSAGGEPGNRVIGSRKGHRHSVETRRKISEANMGHRGAFLGKKFSVEHRQNISLSRFLSTVAWG